MLCLFFSCPPPFRAWAQSLSREAGSWQENGLGWHTHNVPLRQNGDTTSGQVVYGDVLKRPDGVYDVWPVTAGAGVDETRPDNVALPVTLYLGIPA